MTRVRNGAPANPGSLDGVRDFLRGRGTDLASLTRHVGDSLGLERGDALLAVGSVAEGLANRKSDLDLMLVTPRHEERIAAVDECALVIDRCLIDVEVVRVAKLIDLGSRLVAWSRSPWAIAHAAKFTFDERRQLHRLLHGQVLHDRSEGMLSRWLPPRAALAALKLHVARQVSRTIQVDMVGYRETDDYRSLVFSSQELLWHATDALLACHGLTNPMPKWRSRLLERLPDEWEDSLVVRPTGLSANELVWRLARAPEKPTAALALSHAFRIATFARTVFAWAELRALEGSTGENVGIRWPKARSPRPSRDPPLPFLDFDVDFRHREGGVDVGRLNEFGETVVVSPIEFAFVLLFDGTTTATEAVNAMFGRHPSRSDARLAADLIERLTRAKLTVVDLGR